MPDDFNTPPQAEPGFQASLDDAGGDDAALQPIPDGYRSLVSPEQWLEDFSPQQRQLIAERERRAQRNREEQVERLSRDMDRKIQDAIAARVGNGQAQAAPKSNGNGHSSWADLPDNEFSTLYDQAVAALEEAQRDPDNEEAVARASRLTPRLMREFSREEARRQAKLLLDETMSARDGQAKVQNLRQSVKGRIVQDFGGADGEKILTRDHPLYEAAERNYAELVALNGGQDAPGLTYAAYERAAREASRGRLGGIPQRDQEIRDATGRRTAQANRISSLRRKGDVFGAHNLALDSFLNGDNVPDDLVPEHVRRLAPNR